MKNNVDLITELFTKFSDPANFDLSEINTINAYTPRIALIVNTLKELNVNYSIVAHEINVEEGFTRIIFNVYCEFGPSEGPIILLDAHHDIAVGHQENAQDNTCSIINLIILARKLSNTAPSNRIVIAFTDGEEIKPGGCGSGAYFSAIKYKKDLHLVLALELTGLGKSIWVSDSQIADQLNITPKRCPINNAHIYHSHCKNSACIGLLPEDQLLFDYPPVWTLCHRIEDTFDKCDINDMILFTNFLTEVCNQKITNHEIPTS